ncbi:MAG: hypothetical protein ACE5K1_01795 [Acidiferrobacterales bacterium]
MYWLLTILFPRFVSAFYGFEVLHILTGIVAGYITGRLAAGSGLLNPAVVAIVGALLLPLFGLRPDTSPYGSIADYLGAAAYALLAPGVLVCMAESIGDLHTR